jgi:hypothetical protein
MAAKSSSPNDRAPSVRVQRDGLVTVSSPSVVSDLTRYGVPVDSHPPQHRPRQHSAERFRRSDRRTASKG